MSHHPWAHAHGYFLSPLRGWRFAARRSRTIDRPLAASSPHGGRGLLSDAATRQPAPAQGAALGPQGAHHPPALKGRHLWCVATSIRITTRVRSRQRAPLGLTWSTTVSTYGSPHFPGLSAWALAGRPIGPQSRPRTPSGASSSLVAVLPIDVHARSIVLSPPRPLMA